MPIVLDPIVMNYGIFSQHDMLVDLLFNLSGLKQWVVCVKLLFF